jgi:uncharacterized protein YbjT (DUF2867 family)
MKRVVIVGASGMVGGCALRYALQNPIIEQVVSVGRKPLGISHPKLSEVLHADFADCSALAHALSGLQAAVFCLGTYTGAVSATEMRKITVDYALEFARVLRASSPEATFAFLSGNGADPTGRSRIAFARDKGAAESGLRAAGFPRLYLFRPAYIYPVEPRKEPTLSYRLLRTVYPAFRILFPGLSIRSDDLGRVMVNLSIQDTAQPESRVLENRDIQALAQSTTGRVLP